MSSPRNLVRSGVATSAILVTAALAACSSSGGSSGGSAQPPNKAALKSVVLQARDLPSGWKGTPDKSKDSSSPFDKQFHTCVGAKDSSSDQVTEVRSLDYASGQQQISSTAQTYRSQSSVDNDKAIFSKPKVEPCLDQTIKSLFSKSVPSGVRVGQPSMQITPVSGHGALIAQLNGTIPVSAQGRRITVAVKVAFIAAPLTEVTVVATGLGQPIAQQVYDKAVSAVAARAGKL
jgi:hypothetical protein